MKKRICFVDDELKALKALKQSMASVSATWECVCVRSAKGALARMGTESFDAIVTSMHFSGMNGAELLQEAGRLQPKALRFMIGEVADQELVAGCLGGTYQFIARPCPPQALASIVHRSLALDAWLSTDALRKLVPRLQRLPSLPSTYFELLKQIESPSASPESIAEVVGRDPAATARLLQVVNSAALALRRKITDPAEAVAQLGLERVKSVALCVQIFDPHDHPAQAGFSFDSLWSHSLAVATLARDLVLRVSREERAAHEAFTAGLLHDVGRIVLASNLPEEYAAILTAAREHHRPLNDEEFDHLGVTHAQVGAYLLGKWGMPAHFVEATALHHAPDHALTREFGVLAAVHIADALTYDTERAPPEKPDENREEDPSQPQLNAAYLKALNLPTSLAEWRKELAGEAVAREPQAEAPPASPPSEQAPPTATSSDAHHPAVDRSRSRLRFGVPALAVLAVTASLLAWAYHSLAPRPAAAPFRPESGGAKADPAPVGGAAESAVNAQPAAEAPPAPPAPEAAPAPVNTPALAPTPVARETDTPGPGANSVSPPPAPAKAAAKGFASVKLQGIFYGAKNPVAMINGETYGCGDRVNGVQILAITASGVTLSYEGAQKVLQLP